MENVLRHIFRIIIFIILGYIGIMCLILGLIPGIFIIIGLLLVFNYFTMGKVKFKANQERTKNTLNDIKDRANSGIEAAGEGLKILADSGGKLAVKTGKALASGIEAGYKEMGGREGAKKMAKKLGEATGEVVIGGSHFFDELIEGISKGAKEANKQLENKRKKRKELEIQQNVKQIPEAIFEILND